ncbi:MAG: GIY-YIG nuclease family protein [Clostridia bacterium]|nr:GIY-YIG nuclease family protein [Clostridia bacterium]
MKYYNVKENIEKRGNEMSENKKGVIYILTNPSFPEYVKIGYADDVQKRLKQLNKSECVPFAFRIYAVYEVDSRLSDKKVHAIIDKLNPNLRSIEEFEGKPRVREFYAMEAEDAYLILEAIAEINGRADKLKKMELTENEEKAEEIANEIETETQEKAENFSFTKCEIPVGAILQYINDPSITCTVVNERKVEYDNKEMYLTGLAKILLGKRVGICGPRYFTYKGERLDEVRHRLNV